MEHEKKMSLGVGGRKKRVARTSAAAQVAGGGLQWVVTQQRPRWRPSQWEDVRLDSGAPK